MRSVYITANVGCGIGNISSTLYTNGQYELGAGVGFGPLGAGVGNSSMGGTSVNASFGGVGTSYNMKSHSFSYSVNTQAAEEAYNQIVDYAADWSPGGEAVEKTRYQRPRAGNNNVGTAGKLNPDGLFNEGGYLSRVANYIPGINAVAGLHDNFQVNLDSLGGELARGALNVPGMVLAAPITYGALINRSFRSIYKQ